MLMVYTERLLCRLTQLRDELHAACEVGVAYHDRLRAFKHFCDNSPIFASHLNQLPKAAYDFKRSIGETPNQFDDSEASYGLRWNAITQMVDGGTRMVSHAWNQLNQRSQEKGLQGVTKLFVDPIHDLLVDQVKSSSSMLFALLRYKRWAEWFKAAQLRERYSSEVAGGESALDKSLRRFLFESGIEYPFSEPVSPRGKADIVAGLETDDPLVLEVKVWDSSKGYRENRVRDGLRQAMQYAADYGKDGGYIVVFNLDKEPLSFANQFTKNAWPPRIEHGGRTYHFVDVNIADQTKPVSQQEKGRRVSVNEVNLPNLLRE